MYRSPVGSHISASLHSFTHGPKSRYLSVWCLAKEACGCDPGTSNRKNSWHLKVCPALSNPAHQSCVQYTVCHQDSAFLSNSHHFWICSSRINWKSDVFSFHEQRVCRHVCIRFTCIFNVFVYWLCNLVSKYWMAVTMRVCVGCCQLFFSVSAWV